jgi:hypothetical protein
MANATFVNFGPFLLQRMLGRSRILDLWCAEIRGESAYMPCLVRRLLPPYNSSHEYIHILQARCREVRGFQHPAVLLPLECDLQDDVPYVVLELTRGWNLRELLDFHIDQGRSIPVELAVKLIFPVVHGLASAHMRPSFPLVHGAVRPQSIWVSDDGTARLADFEIGGLAELELGAPERSGD